MGAPRTWPCWMRARWPRWEGLERVPVDTHTCASSDNAFRCPDSGGTGVSVVVHIGVRKGQTNLAVVKSTSQHRYGLAHFRADDL